MSIDEVSLFLIALVWTCQPSGPRMVGTMKPDVQTWAPNDVVRPRLLTTWDSNKCTKTLFGYSDAELKKDEGLDKESNDHEAVPTMVYDNGRQEVLLPRAHTRSCLGCWTGSYHG